VARHDRIGPLLVAALGVAALAARPFATAQTAVRSSGEASIPEIIITAAREADAALTAKVVQVLMDDPYVLADHISVETDNGVVRLRGFAQDASDLRRALRLARRAAGGRRVVNEVELIPHGSDTN
jgi:osmotically-inducible protein OsmY